MAARGIDQRAERFERAELRMHGRVAAVRRADRVRAADVVGAGLQAVVAALRAVVPIGWIGGKYSTSKPMSRMRGRCAITSSNVPCRCGSSLAERGNISYQLEARARLDVDRKVVVSCVTNGR